jgi:hypothetical protein
MNVRLRDSSTAWCSSGKLFIMIGPHRAIGSAIGALAISKNRAPSGTAVTVFVNALAYARNHNVDCEY